MISSLDETIKQLLIRNVPVNTAEVDVVFDVPDRDWSSALVKPTINCYLYDIHENKDLRQTGWDTEKDSSNAATKRRPPVRIDLSYLVTVWSRAVEDEHYLLWRVLAALMRYPVLPSELLQGDLSGHPLPIRTWTAQQEGVLANPADAWTALENQLKPYVNYTITLALDLEVILHIPPVRAPAVVRVEPLPPAPVAE